jgi:uncharacterized membrane protein
MYQIVSVAAVISYFVPLLLVLLKRLWNDRFFMLFAAYWSIGGFINLLDVIPNVPMTVRYTISVTYNLIDVPMILAILYYTSNSILVRRFATLAIVAAAATEIIGLALNGLTYDALKYSLGLGILLVLIVVIWEIIRYLQKVEHSNRQNAKIFIYAALLFEYATFIIIYIFDYFVDSSDKQDNFLIYYLSSLVALFIASCGYLLFKKYEKKSFSYIKD